MKTERILELLECERECVLRNIGTGCQRDCAACDLVQDADELHEMYDTVILLLGGIEPHVLTLSEINVLDQESAFEFPICVEERVPAGKWTGGSTLKWCGSGFLRECYLEDGGVYYNAETYNVTWRAWLVWPTPEQREATPWEG